jgi:hypothetical protein
MKRSLLVLIFCTTTAIAQPTVAVHLGGQFPFSETYSGLGFFRDDYWRIGLNAGLEYDVAVTQWLRLLPGIEYTLFPLKSNARFHGVYSANLFPLRASGDGFHRLSFDLECRVHWPDNVTWFRPFVEMDGGYLLERVGKKIFTFGPYQSEFVNESVNRSAWAFGFGFGTELWVTRDMRVQPSIRYHSSIDEHLYGLFVISMVYAFCI